MDAAALRAEFPVLERTAYLNAGTCGPVPEAAVRATRTVLARAAAEGRGSAHFHAMLATRARLRRAYADLLGADADDVAITTCTSHGIVEVLAALGLGPGDEVLTTEEEHPGVLGPLGAARALRGIDVRVVAFADVADAITPATKLVACSHVSWVSGRIVPDLSGAGDVPVLLDGAQGIGAVPTSVDRLGCAFYAGSGQKWLCGPIGSGMLWVSPGWAQRLPATGPTYLNLVDPAAGLDAVAHAGARASTRPRRASRRPPAPPPRSTSSPAPGGTRCTSGPRRSPPSWPSGSPTPAARSRRATRTTLVSWREPDPEAIRDTLRDAGVIVRDLPGTGLVRASVGAWNDASDLDRLLSALA